MKNLVGVIVNHKKFGEGVIEQMEKKDDFNYHLTANFGGNIKIFSFPECMNKFLFSNDLDIMFETSELLNAIEEHKRQIEEERKKLLFHQYFNTKMKMYNSKEHGSYNWDNCNSDFKTMFKSDRTSDVKFDTEYDKFFALGYLACNLDRITAQLSVDREDDFVAIFGDADRTVSNYRDNRSACQFRIELSSDRKIPSVLDNAICEFSSSHKAIARSKFIFDLVHDFGFEFGDSQNVSNIFDIVSNLGYADAFSDGFVFN